MKTLLLKVSVPFLLAIVLPPSSLLIWLGLAMILDLITGVSKAIRNNVPRTSTGFRQTVVKFIQYGGAIAIGIILANISEFNKDESSEWIYKYFSNTMLLFMIYIEIKSVFENLIEISPDSDFTRFFLKPIHDLLSIDFSRFVKKPQNDTKS
jgi:uncharacterized membrane protein